MVNVWIVEINDECVESEAGRMKNEKIKEMG